MSLTPYSALFHRLRTSRSLLITSFPHDDDGIQKTSHSFLHPSHAAPAHERAAPGPFPPSHQPPLPPPSPTPSSLSSIPNLTPTEFPDDQNDEYTVLPGHPNFPHSLSIPLPYSPRP